MDRTMFASDRYFKACSRHMCVLLTYFPPLSFITDVLIVLQILKSDRGFWGSVLATFGFLVSILVSLVTNLGNTCMHMPLPSLLAFTSLTLTLFPCEYVVFAFNEPYLWKGLFDDYSYDPLMRFCLKGIRVKQFPRWPPRSWVNEQRNEMISLFYSRVDPFSTYNMILLSIGALLYQSVILRVLPLTSKIAWSLWVCTKVCISLKRPIQSGRS